jgi:enterochelin esterase-like enzyme
MLEPQSTVLFILLALGFGALMWWMLIARRVLLRVLAAGLAFVLAVVFGVMVVNKYYGYYQTWGAAVADLTSQGISVPQVAPSAFTPGALFDGFDRSLINLELARQQGFTAGLTITGKRSDISREVYIYLPPQYFQPRYRNYRFPVIELIHGQPGTPQDWIDVVGVTITLDRLMKARRARPAVLVMPDANGGIRVSLQCLNQVGGPQDLTYLGVDLPDEIAHILRVQRPGPGWGVAGYSEGGFCAANMALRLRHSFGFAGVLSGYFRPFNNELANPMRRASPFGRDRALRRENTPQYEAVALPAGTVIPRFWLGAGTGDRQDVSDAEYFWQELSLRQTGVPLVLTPGGGHTMATWRREVPAMLEWMTSGLAKVAGPAPAPAPARVVIPVCSWAGLVWGRQGPDNGWLVYRPGTCPGRGADAAAAFRLPGGSRWVRLAGRSRPIAPAVA